MPNKITMILTNIPRTQILSVIHSVRAECMQFRHWNKTSIWLREFEIVSKKQKKNIITVGRGVFSNSCRFLQKRYPFAWSQNCTSVFCLWSPVRLKLWDCKRKGKLTGAKTIEKWNGNAVDQF